MCRILLIETSSKNCSVALSANGIVTGCVELASDEYVHAEKLHQFIAELLANEKVSLKDLDAVCVSKGPGSYTGLRIGVSAAKGFCYALSIPLLAIETTLILASYAREKRPLAKQFLPMIDARRMEVYCALYDLSLGTIMSVNAVVVDESFFQLDEIESTILVGDGVEKFGELIPHSDNTLPCFPSATMMAGIAHQKFIAKEFEDVAYFEPFYLKDFIAGVPKRVL